MAMVPFSGEHEAEWYQAIRFLILQIYHRRPAEERDELYNMMREAVGPQHREEVGEMVHSYAQVLVAQGRAEGEKKGEKKGEAKGRAETLLELLEIRFGKLPLRMKSAVRSLSPERLKELTRQVVTANSLEELHLD